VDFAVEDDQEAAFAGIVEGGVLERSELLRDGWKGGVHVGSLLHGVENGAAYLFADDIAERACAEEFAERAVGLDVADLGDELELGLTGDLWSEFDLDLRVAGDEALRFLLAHEFDAGVAFVVESHDGYGRGWCRSEGRVLDVDGFVAVVVFVEFGPEERSEVALEVSEITVEFQREVFMVGIFGRGACEVGPSGYCDELALNVERDFDGGCLEPEFLCDGTRWER